eukprot:4134036-Prymnesium_polylepis.1
MSRTYVIRAVHSFVNDLSHILTARASGTCALGSDDRTGGRAARHLRIPRRVRSSARCVANIKKHVLSWLLLPLVT